VGLFKKLFGGADARANGANDAVNTGAPRRPPEIDAAGLAEKLKSVQPPFLLDVREPYEYQDAHIDSAVLMPLGVLQQRVGQLPKDREIVCICQSGSRSGSATRMLVAAGYNVINLRGGMFTWIRGGQSVKRTR
jgi:rhodanese-related sulfurtransferase